MYKLTVFRDLFGRISLSFVLFFDKIAEGPDSFCHHCTMHRAYNKIQE